MQSDNEPQFKWDARVAAQQPVSAESQPFRTGFIEELDELFSDGFEDASS